MSFLHPLTVLRRQLQMSITALADLSGIDEQTIVRIETDPGNRVNYTTAEAIAKALNREVHALFHLGELTNLGRPALTGGPIRKGEEDWKGSGRFCLNCFLLQPIMEHPECPYCGSKHSMEDRHNEESDDS